MTYATLMVQLELGRCNVSPLGVARDLARRMHASVTGIATAQPLETAIMADGFYAGTLTREDNECIDREAQAAEKEFRNEMKGHPDGLDWNMAVTRYPLSDRIAGMTGTADILVAGVDQLNGGSANASRRVDVDDLIMQTGRPVLVVPLGVEHFDFRCALVAWKEGREARRAVADALPLLRLMDKVVVAEIADTAQQGVAQAGLNRMVAWLARHGIVAISRLARPAGDDGNRLIALADEEGAELIVAGAYGHARFHEWVLGGVTRTLLRHGGRCLLLSH